MLATTLLTTLLGASAATAAVVQGVARRQDAPDTTYPPNSFPQLIDHFPDSDRYAPHDNGTFTQRYFFDASYYKPGGPVFLYIGGETSGESRFSNLETGIVQILMQQFNGLGVILENRYYGESYPYNTTTTDQLAYLTTEQTIADNAYFATHATQGTFPGVDCDLSAPGTPWILYGGSLAGAQTAFSIKTYGGDKGPLYGGIASSAVIHTVKEYPEWYNPIMKFAPQDCVQSIIDIIDKFDMLVSSGNRDAVDQFKALFGLETLSDDRDFAMTIAFPIGGPMNYPTSTWQELNWNSSYGSNDFFEFCGNVTNLNAPENITQIDYALANYTNGEPWTNLGNYANYVVQAVLPYCTTGQYNTTSDGCFSTQNETYWADTTNSVLRSYLYSTCTEQGVYQVAPPHGPSLISRVLTDAYTQQWCTWGFPAGEYNSVPSTGPNLTYYNSYGDLNFTAERLAFIDGNQDVWLDVCYHSHNASERYQTSDLMPELLITGAGHHWDSYGILDVPAEPQFIREAHYWEIRSITRWLRTFKDWKPTSS